ncbi:hypothetical protein QQP08_003623 [Theobroma cacao]|nr:hypothetical protein QQP08_003623 [Theobroma cacao]
MVPSATMVSLLLRKRNSYVRKFCQDSVVSDMVAYANRRTSVILSKDKEYVFFSVLVNFVQSYLSIYDSKCIYGGR